MLTNQASGELVIGESVPKACLPRWPVQVFTPFISYPKLDALP